MSKIFQKALGSNIKIRKVPTGEHGENKKCEKVHAYNPKQFAWHSQMKNVFGILCMSCCTTGRFLMKTVFELGFTKGIIMWTSFNSGALIKAFKVSPLIAFFFRCYKPTNVVFQKFRTSLKVLQSKRRHEMNFIRLLRTNPKAEPFFVVNLLQQQPWRNPITPLVKQSVWPCFFFDFRFLQWLSIFDFMSILIFDDYCSISSRFLVCFHVWFHSLSKVLRLPHNKAIWALRICFQNRREIYKKDYGVIILVLGQFFFWKIPTVKGK